MSSAYLRELTKIKIWDVKGEWRCIVSIIFHLNDTWTKLTSFIAECCLCVCVFFYQKNTTLLSGISLFLFINECKLILGIGTSIIHENKFEKRRKNLSNFSNTFYSLQHYSSKNLQIKNTEKFSHINIWIFLIAILENFLKNS